MYATERQEIVERLLHDDGRVSVVELAERFQVTTETVRRDLDQLEQAGSLRRVHGGAVLPEAASTNEASLSDRTQHRSAAKAAIGRRARSLLGADFEGSLYFDAGTTTAAVAAEFAPELSSGRIDVVTHSVALAHALAEQPHVALTLIGGRVRGLTSAAVGAGTIRAIEGMRPDVAFIGTNGVSAGFGLSTPDAEEAAVKRAIVSVARRVVVVADAEKFGRELLFGFATLSEIDALVTDADPDDELALALHDADVEVRIA